MIVEERMRTFINSLDAGNTPFLDELECSGALDWEDAVPIIRKEMQSFLKVLLALKKPQRILEVGTAVGFSTLLMCEYSQPKCISQRLKIMKREFRLQGKISKSRQGVTDYLFGGRCRANSERHFRSRMI